MTMLADQNIHCFREGRHTPQAPHRNGRSLSEARAAQVPCARMDSVSAAAHASRRRASFVVWTLRPLSTLLFRLEDAYAH